LRITRPSASWLKPIVSPARLVKAETKGEFCTPPLTLS
jgi:hypothetical protein